MSKDTLRFGLILTLLMAISSCNPVPQEFGILEGQVSIGPLEPVHKVGEEAPTPAPEVYAAREIVVYKKDGVTEFTRLSIDSSGGFRGELPVGVYVIDINRIGIDSADNLPVEIEIKPNSVTRLDINIDTGIR